MKMIMETGTCFIKFLFLLLAHSFNLKPFLVITPLNYNISRENNNNLSLTFIGFLYPNQIGI